MSLENFSVVESNPNGGGCLCSPERQATGCTGPFVVFHAAQVVADFGPDGGPLNNLSPYPVIGAKCAAAMTKKLKGKDGPH